MTYQYYTATYVHRTSYRTFIFHVVRINLRTVLRFPAHAGKLGDAVIFFCMCRTICDSLGIIPTHVENIFPAHVGQFLAMLEYFLHVEV